MMRRISCARVCVSGGGGVGTVEGGGGCGARSGVEKEPRENTFGCICFLWKEERVRLLVGSPGASTTPIYSPGSSSTPINSLGSSSTTIYSPGSSSTLISSPGSSRNAECSNRKHLLDKITVLEATVDMYMHPEQHIVNSTALFHEVALYWQEAMHKPKTSSNSSFNHQCKARAISLFLEGMPQAISLHVKEYQKKDKIGSKPDKNGKRGEAGKGGSYRNMGGYVNPRNQTNALIVPTSKMCLMEGNEEEIILPEVTHEEIPQISLNALTGVRWLGTLGDIIWNFTSLKMQLQHEGRHVALRETTKYPIQWFSRKQLTKHVTQKATNLSSMRLCVPTTFVMSLNVTHKPLLRITQNQALNESLKEFKDVFILPTALPPKRHHDNRIPLKEGATYVNIRPYKHPPSQKDAIMSMKDGTWRICIDYRHFQIKTNHFSLKYFLDQRITTPFQSKWLPKLRGFDYEILYKRGKENQAVDALSRSVHGAGHLRRKRKLVVGNNDTVRCKLVNHFHNFAKGGHSGVLAITKRFANWFYWKGMQKAIKKVWLALAEFWYNIKFHSSTTTTPFEIVYCQTPPQYVTYKAGECWVEAVDRTLVSREEDIQFLQFYLKRAQNKMQSMSDKHSKVLWAISNPKESGTGSIQVGAAKDEGLIAATPIAVLDRRMVDMC
nr:reverse transcriptase [Tanacetum cinerariifolium]